MANNQVSYRILQYLVLVVPKRPRSVFFFSPCAFQKDLGSRFNVPLALMIMTVDCRRFHISSGDVWFVKRFEYSCAANDPGSHSMSGLVNGQLYNVDACRW